VVVVAKEPIPSVSKKLVMNPTPIRSNDVRDHRVTKTAVTSRSAASRIVLGSDSVNSQPPMTNSQDIDCRGSPALEVGSWELRIDHPCESWD
jgi:hypothetical protein